MDPVRERLAELAPGVELLENLRFDVGQEGNDPAFVEAARAGDRRRRDGCVRCSRTGPTPRSSARRLAVPLAMGRLLEQEVEVLLGLRNKPEATVRRRRLGVRR